MDGVHCFVQTFMASLEDLRSLGTGQVHLGLKTG